MRCKAVLPEHEHQTVAQTTLCWRTHHPEYFGIKATTAPVQSPPFPPSRPVASLPPVTPPAVAPPVAGKRDWRNDPVSQAQLDKIDKLGGDAVHAAKLTKGEASDYIDRLLTQPRTEPTVTHSPASGGIRSAYADRLNMVKGMIGLVPEGNYATAPEGENRHVNFLRITRPTHGRLRGSLHIQTRHADTLKTRIIAADNGNGWWDIKPQSWGVIDMLMEVIADYKTCALRYSVESESCSHCSTPLTDDRSRHYLVGPICEKQHGYIWPVLFADEQNGMTFEELQARGLPFGRHHQAFLTARA